MKTKLNLTSELGNIFIYVTIIFGVGILFFLTYSIIILAIPAIIICIGIEISFYIKFYRPFLKFKNVFFDDEFIYFDNQSIPLKSIIEIEKGKIIYIKEGEDLENELYYNSFYSTNFEILENFYYKTI
ncbi:hypothetical protein [Flavobacterium sp.]|uniref:hypothetical protein n=1 Tax=Flavobacterium sp. TaxID=239 RepID=UPI003D12CB91